MIKVYIDMDQVLADLDERMHYIYGKDVFLRGEDHARRCLSEFTDNGGFISLDPMPHAFNIEDFVIRNKNKAKFEILTSHGSFHHDPSIVEMQKKEFLFCKFFKCLYHLPMNVTPNGLAKAEFSKAGTILIDDQRKNVDAFNEGYGQAFLYTTERHHDIMRDVQFIIDKEYDGGWNLS